MQFTCSVILVSGVPSCPRGNKACGEHRQQKRTLTSDGLLSTLFQNRLWSFRNRPVLIPGPAPNLPLSGHWDQYAWSTPARSHWADLAAPGERMYYPHSVGEKAEAQKSFTTPPRPQLWHGWNGTRRLRSLKFALLPKAASPESITLIFSISQSACPKAITQILTERMQSCSREYLHYLVHS